MVALREDGSHHLPKESQSDVQARTAPRNSLLRIA